MLDLLRAFGGFGAFLFFLNGLILLITSPGEGGGGGGFGASCAIATNEASINPTQNGVACKYFIKDDFFSCLMIFMVISFGNCSIITLKAPFNY